MVIQCIVFVFFVFSIQGIIGQQSDQSDQCTITIWHQNRDVTEMTINIRDGEQVELLCDARCVGQDVTPTLKWGRDAPNRVYFQDMPGRVYTSSYMDHRLQTLYLKGFSQQDVGSYMCRGWIGKYVTAHVNIRLESTDTDSNIGKLLFQNFENFQRDYRKKDTVTGRY